MTSTDSSASNNTNQNNTSNTSEPVAALETSSKAMTNESNSSQVLANDTTQEVKENNTDTSNLSSSEASSSPSSSSPASSSPTSSNDTSTDKTQTLEEKASNKDTKSTNNSHKTNNHSKKNTNQNQNSMEHSPIASGSMPNNQQPHQQFVNYYPTYIPRHGRQVSQQNTVNVQAPPYTQIDGAAPQQWPHAVAAAAMAAMAANDPMAIAQYMGNGQNGVPPQGPYPPSGNPADLTQQQYDQFSFGFTPAFGFGYTGNGSIDYAAIQAAQPQGGSNLNPQSNQWTPSSNSTATGTTTTTTAANPSNPTSSPANTTTSSSDTTSSVPSTVPSETSATNSNAKWVQVMQDPLAVHEFNAFQQQQLSPVDLYTPQHHHQPHHNYRSHGHHHYQRHQQHLQPNYHHYQYNNPYHIQHYQNQYTNMHHPMQHHHYNNSHNSSKYNNYQKNNNYNNNNENTGSNYQIHDNNNNSNKSNNLNNTESEKSVVPEVVNGDQNGDQTGQNNNTEIKSDSGSKSWASVVGVSTTTSSANTPASTQQTSTGSSPTMNEAPQYQNYNQYDQHTNNFNEYSMKSKNNYYRNNIKNQQHNNYETQQQLFDLTNRSFPSLNASDSITKAELSENIKKATIKKVDSSLESTQPAQQFSQNSKKQQQYNNYQRQQQQQFNLPVGKYQNYQNGSVNYSLNNQRYNNGTDQSSSSTRGGEKSYNKESSYYNKRHQPTQHTLSSFLNIIDKSKFDDAKKNASISKSTSVVTNQSTNDQSGNNDAQVAADSTIDQLNQQVVDLNIDPSQLIVYTNPGAYNPKEFNTSPKAARFFVIKSYSEDDIHRSIKYNIWCSTEHGNRRLDSAYFKGDGQVPVYLFFSVNGSGHFCGMAEMQSRVDYNKKTGVWAQDKWRGCFQVKWVYVKDVPNSLLRNIKLENNDNKPVTNSRDTQEIPYDKGRQVLKVFHTYNHSSSILDDFEHYERKQEEDKNIHHNFSHQNVMLSGNEQMNNIQDQMHIQNSNSTNTNDDLKPEITAKDDSVQNSSTTNTTTSSPSASSSSSTSSIDESKLQQHQQEQPQVLEKPQQLVTSSS